MIPKAIGEIAEQDFLSLVSTGKSEGRLIEFKQAIELATDADRKEFLYDVSSFSNADGGDLIFAVTAQKVWRRP